MLSATHATFLVPRFSTAHWVERMLLGTGPWFVEAMFFDSKHSRTAQAEATTATPSSS